MKKIAIIGAGISGLSCARTLLENQCIVDIFEKETHPGGRFATDFHEHNDASFYFDHGAQYFTVKSHDLKENVEHWIQQGVVAPWRGRIGKVQDGELQPEQNAHERFVGVPHMRALTQQMADGLNLKTSNYVNTIRQKNNKWILHLENESESSEYDAVVISIPPPQAVRLLSDSIELKIVQDACSAISMNPCWATLVSFASVLPVGFDGIFGDESSVFSWVCRDSSKPQRPPGERFVLHASNQWTRNHLNKNADVVSELLLKEFFDMTKTPPIAADFLQSHLWHYAAPTETNAIHHIADESKTLVLCGDWCHSGRVEGAFLSGQETGRSIISALAQ